MLFPFSYFKVKSKNSAKKLSGIYFTMRALIYQVNLIHIKNPHSSFRREFIPLPKKHTVSGRLRSHRLKGGDISPKLYFYPFFLIYNKNFNLAGYFYNSTITYIIILGLTFLNKFSVSVKNIR